MKHQTCLAPNCNRESTVRGLCASHYGIAAALVKQNKTSWDKLIKAGKAIPSRKKSATKWFLS